MVWSEWCTCMMSMDGAEEAREFRLNLKSMWVLQK